MHSLQIGKQFKCLPAQTLRILRIFKQGIFQATTFPFHWNARKKLRPVDLSENSQKTPTLSKRWAKLNTGQINIVYFKSCMILLAFLISLLMFEMLIKYTCCNCMLQLQARAAKCWLFTRPQFKHFDSCFQYIIIYLDLIPTTNK